MKLLIVDDEQLARQRMHELLLEIDPELEIWQAENGLGCVRIASEANVDIVLLDIRMPGMDGFEAAGHLATLPAPPAIIFTTAYEDRAVEAFETNAVDYLLKPIRRSRLQESLQRASFINHARLAGIDASLGRKNPARRYLSANYQGNMVLVPVAEIRYLRAEQKYVTVGWPGHEILVDDPLKAIEEEFGTRFLRVHRNALVAPAHVESLEKDARGKFRVKLHGVEARIDISRRHLAEVRQAIRNLRSPE